MSNNPSSYKYVYKKNMNETEDLIDNFKYKYEEIKYILDNKIKEFNSAEENQKAINERFASKLEELEIVNDQMRGIILSKEKEAELYIGKLNELNNKFFTLEKETEKNNKYFRITLIEKDVYILKNRIKLKSCPIIYPT